MSTDARDRSLAVLAAAFGAMPVGDSLGWEEPWMLALQLAQQGQREQLAKMLQTAAETEPGRFTVPAAVLSWLANDIRSARALKRGIKSRLTPAECLLWQDAYRAMPRGAREAFLEDFAARMHLSPERARKLLQQRVSVRKVE